MLPRWHIVLGAVFTAILYFSVPEIGWFYLTLVFLSSFLIDFDHYASSIINSRKFLTLKESFVYYDKAEIQQKKDIAAGIKRQGDFHFFHTLEFHTLVGLFGLVWNGFFFIFLGMFFHSLLDVIAMVNEGALHRREYFFFNWLRKQV